jgi:NAD(P)-dependent dehydrogenase (short-subunit alcohol dehydrogenase family)
MKLRDKIVLVTGGKSGIGRAIAPRAAAEGAHVAITGRDPAKGAKVLGELQAAGAAATFFPADLGDEAQAAKMVGAVAAHFGRIDVLVNNAGAGARRIANARNRLSSSPHFASAGLGPVSKDNK